MKEVLCLFLLSFNPISLEAMEGKKKEEIVEFKLQGEFVTRPNLRPNNKYTSEEKERFNKDIKKLWQDFTEFMLEVMQKHQKVLSIKDDEVVIEAMLKLTAKRSKEE